MDFSVRRAPMMNLREVVERYATLAASFGDPVGLASFDLSPEETENLFSSFDEDYHISRFLSFAKLEGKSYAISGNEATHVRITEGVKQML